MIFLGDIACPSDRVVAFNECTSLLTCLRDEVVILNFEATIAFDGDIVEGETLYNHPNALDGINKVANKVVVSLANNHMYDYPSRIVSTKEYLETKGIGTFGLQEADGRILPFEYADNQGKKYAFFGHCWNLYTRTNQNKENSIKVVDVNYKEFLEVIKKYIVENKGTAVYCFMHWNYDMEKYPFPMHIKFSRDLIDCGVAGVIGSHSHVIHGVELYKNKPIAYGLGNFYIPSGVFFNGNLKYPEASKETIGVNISDNRVELLWFSTDCKQVLRLDDIISFSSEKMDSYSPFTKMSSKQYRGFFVKNRVKRVFVPIFSKYEGIDYTVKNKLAILRIKIIKLLQKIIK